MGQRLLVSSLLALALLLAAGCVQKSPEQIVTETRTQYFLEPTGMLVQKPEPEMEPIDEGLAEGEDGGAEAESEDAIGEEVAMDDDAPRTANVLFDLIVRFDGLGDSLSGITIEVAHSDPFEKEKGRYLQWIETEGMRKGEARQISFEREIPDYVTGDTFNIEFREYIPVEERGDYREYDGIGS